VEGHAEVGSEVGWELGTADGCEEGAVVEGREVGCPVGDVGLKDG
jgi:hypothetical protein